MNKLLLRKASIVAILCGVMMITGCASLHTASLTIEPTAVLTAVPTQAPTAKPALQVDSFASLKAACESKDSITIRLTKDITSTDDLKILSPSNKKREVTLDLNGHTLFFENEKSMYVDSIIAEGDTKPQVTFTLTSGKKGGSVIFMLDSLGAPSGIISECAKFVLDGDVTVTSAAEIPFSESIGGSLIFVGYYGEGSENCVFIMNSGTIDAHGNYGCAVRVSGQAIINNGLIKVSDGSKAVTNEAGKVRMNGGEIQASGDNCVAIDNMDTYNPIDPIENAPEPGRDTFVMIDGTISANGKDAVAVSLQVNCKVSGGTILATGKNSVGISYGYENKFTGVSDKALTHDINLVGGRITAESHALINNAGNKASYKNAKGETVAVDPSVKEIDLG